MRYLIDGVTGIFSGSFYNGGCIALEGNDRLYEDLWDAVQIISSNKYLFYR